MLVERQMCLELLFLCVKKCRALRLRTRPERALLALKANTALCFLHSPARRGLRLPEVELRQERSVSPAGAQQYIMPPPALLQVAVRW